MPKPAIAIIQARMSSSRLPGKVMKPLAGKAVIWHIYNRALSCGLVDQVVVATSEDKTDDALADYCKQNKMNHFRGSLENVLSRYTEILEKHNYEYYVRITGDCPLIHPPYIDEKISALMKFDGDVLWSEEESSVLEGQGVQSVRSLKYIKEKSTDPEDLEHVGSKYLAEHPDEFRIVETVLPELYTRKSFRLTIDEEKDYQLFVKIFEELYPVNNNMDLSLVIKWLNQHKQEAAINNSVSHKELNIRIKEIRKKWIHIEKAGKVRLKF